ncbi:hypothetical protein VMCG_00419 [Cytospora schulzeri]|uniref:Anaphase-promoting complex subunit 4 WD40 domain-containing protein n=1 Tax=Cytospora schulzeri TaxID=448051 RepID=A0A423XA41_9PEZI|nr:hypothetical protein VMCG_00419 [Valsa malicola]
MRFSRSFEASPHCLPSPHGKLVATLSASTIHIRSIDSLRTVRHISLPRDFTGPVAFFQWSSSSRLILVASVDQIHVFSAVEDGFHATIRSPVPPAAKPVFIGFGPSDTQAWSGPQVLIAADADINLGPGAKVVEFSADARLLAIGDSSRRICILDMASVTESRRLQHPNSITPTDALQVWQEQVGSSGHHFVRALQTIYPPNGQTTGNTQPQSGCAIMAFDISSALLATKLDDAPSTIWIWDTTTAELRAVLLFHGNISKISWHPTIRETLLVVSEGDSYNSLAFIWDPLSSGPKPIDLSGRLTNSKLQLHWLNVSGLEPGALFASDSRQYLLASLAVDEDEPVPWSSDGESSTMLSDNSQHVTTAHTDDDSEGEASELDDTFCFKKA